MGTDNLLYLLTDRTHSYLLTKALIVSLPRYCKQTKMWCNHVATWKKRRA